MVWRSGLRCFWTVLHYGLTVAFGKGFTWCTRYGEANQRGEELAVADVQDEENLGGILLIWTGKN